MKLVGTALVCVWIAAAPSIQAQTNRTDTTNRIDRSRAIQTVRDSCIQGRRIVCGRIVKVLPEGLIVDSGYTSLRRQPLDRSWLIPSTVEAEREPNLVEKNEPDCVCVGLVFLTDLPKSPRTKPKVIDYAVIEGFPAGQYTYNSVGTVQRTVRRFSASLHEAVQLNLQAVR